MPIPSNAEKCLAFVNTMLQPPEKKGRGGKPLGERPLVTISRQTGAGGVTLGETLAEYLNAHGAKGSLPWTLFDKNLVQRILEDHALPARIAAFIQEDRSAGVEDAVGEILGLHPSAWRLIQHTTETVLRLAETGNVILVGRGSTVITQHLPLAFHVRVIGSTEPRIDRIRALFSLSRKAAAAHIDREDRARRRYMLKYFKRDPDDPLLYDLVLNTDRVSIAEAARMVGDAVLSRSE
jgi:cytidylate kinase